MKNHSNTYIRRHTPWIVKFKTLLNICDFSPSVGHTLYSDYSAAQTHVIVVYTGVVCLFRFHGFFLEILSLSHIRLHTFTYRINSSIHTIRRYVMPCAIAYFYNHEFHETRATPKMKKTYAKSPCNRLCWLGTREWVPSATNNCTQFTNTSWRPKRNFTYLTGWLVGWRTPGIFFSDFFFLFAFVTIWTLLFAFFQFFIYSFFCSLSFFLSFWVLFCISILSCALNFFGSTNQLNASHRKMTIVKLINFHIETYTQRLQCRDLVFCVFWCGLQSAKRKK